MIPVTVVVARSIKNVMDNKTFSRGIVVFLIGGVGWFVAVIASVITFGKLRDVANFFGIVAVAGLLLVVAGSISKLLNRHKKHEK